MKPRHKDRFMNPHDGSRKHSSPQIHSDIKDKIKQSVKGMSTEEFEEYIHEKLKKLAEEE